MNDIKPLRCSRAPMCMATRMTYEGWAEHEAKHREEDHIIEQTNKIDFDAIRKRLAETDAMVARHRPTQRRLREIEVTI